MGCGDRGASEGPFRADAACGGPLARALESGRSGGRTRDQHVEPLGRLRQRRPGQLRRSESRDRRLHADRRAGAPAVRRDRERDRAERAHAHDRGRVRRDPTARGRLRPCGPGEQLPDRRCALCGRGPRHHRSGVLRLRRRPQHAQRLGSRRAVCKRRALGPGRATGGAPRPPPRRRGAAWNARLDAPGRRTVDARAMSAVGPRNLARLADETFERRGNYSSLWFERVWHTSGDLFARGERIAAGLAERGVAAGDRVVVMMENCPDVPVVYHAIWRAGGVVTPAIFLLTAEELRRLIADARPALLLTTPTFREVADEAANGVRVISDLGPLEHKEHMPIVPRDDDDLAALV